MRCRVSDDSDNGRDGGRCGCSDDDGGGGHISMMAVVVTSRTKGLLPEDPETSHSPHHVPSATQMGHVRIWKISQGMSQSGRQRDIN